jgi:hypothetical protein
VFAAPKRLAIGVAGQGAAAAFVQRLASNPGTGALTEFAARVLRRELAQPERSG